MRKKPADLLDFVEQVIVDEPDYTNVVGQDSLNRFEHTFKKKKRPNKKRKKRGNKNQPQNQGGNNQNKNSGNNKGKQKPNAN